MSVLQESRTDAAGGVDDARVVLVGRQVQDGADRCTGSSGRMQILTRPDGVTVINDAYNANPDSMTAALNTLASLTTPDRTIAVLGEMREIGDESGPAHREIGRTAARLGLRQIITVGGRAASAMAEATQAEGIIATHVTDKERVPALLSKILTAGDHVLVKGANALGMETTAQQILRQEID
ncbi:glutamate ligase domain-containing protein [Streptomyces hypolithicus]